MSTSQSVLSFLTDFGDQSSFACLYFGADFYKLIEGSPAILVPKD